MIVAQAAEDAGFFFAGRQWFQARTPAFADLMGWIAVPPGSLSDIMFPIDVSDCMRCFGPCVVPPPVSPRL